MISRILQDSHIYYDSCWIPSRAQLHTLEKIVQTYLLAKYGGAKGLLLVAWGVCIMRKDEGVLGLIYITTDGCILVGKWVVR